MSEQSGKYRDGGDIQPMKDDAFYRFLDRVCRGDR